MGFFDLNIPYHESDRHANYKSSLKRGRLKLALKAMELGYTGVAYNRTLKGVMSESDRCSTPLFHLSKLIPSSSSFFTAVKFHRELLDIAVASPFRQYTRLTVVVDISSQTSALNAGNPILRSYDIVAIRAMNQNAFDQACQTAEVDMIAIDFGEKLPFRLKQPMVKVAIQRGLYFEITYSSLVADAQTRRQMISNCKLLVDWTRGKNLIISSGAHSVTELRGAQDVANLLSLLGLPSERAKAAISKNCRSLLANALRKKHFHKEAVRVEQIPSGEQQSAFDDWLKWDPISSGEGDLLLEDMEKSFAIPNTQTETVKTINFTSGMNGLPVHGLQIKDLMSVTKAALEQPKTNIFEPAAMEIEKPEEQISLLENQDSVTNLSKEQASPSDVANIDLPSGCQDSKVSLDYDSKRIVTVQPLLEEIQTSVNDANGGNHAMSSFQSYNDAYSNSGETIPVSSENLSSSNDLEANLGPSELQSPSPVFAGNVLRITIFEPPVSDSHISVELSNPLNESSFTLEESNVEKRCDVGVPVNIVPNKIHSENKKNDGVYAEGEQYCEMTYSPVELCDGLPNEGPFNLKTDLNQPISYDVMEESMQTERDTNYRGFGKSQAGRERRKRNSCHRPFLFPFKRFVNPRPSKRKSWKQENL